MTPDEAMKLSDELSNLPPLTQQALIAAVDREQAKVAAHQKRANSIARVLEEIATSSNYRTSAHLIQMARLGLQAANKEYRNEQPTPNQRHARSVINITMDWKES